MCGRQHLSFQNFNVEFIGSKCHQFISKFWRWCFNMISQTTVTCFISFNILALPYSNLHSTSFSSELLSISSAADDRQILLGDDWLETYLYQHFDGNLNISNSRAVCFRRCLWHFTDFVQNTKWPTIGPASVAHWQTKQAKNHSMKF